MKKYALYLLLLLLLGSCGISEDCFKGNGNQVTQSFPLTGFTKIKVYNGIGLVVKEGPNYEVNITTSDNILDKIDISLTGENGEMLVVKDNSTCNIARDYGQTTVYITVPDGTISTFPLIQELELHSKTEQKIQSEGILHSPIVRLFSLGDDGDEAGTSDFYIHVDNNQFVVESNTVSNFYINGHCNEMLLNFYFGNGRFYGDELLAENIKLFHRGSNDMMVFPIQKIEGTIYATGNVILKNVPPIVNVEEVYTGRIIY
ncbi:GIN domain-containing protein [Flavobacterium sp.]|uniref:GIN domain-containing protein n=1 Tax=Flavobacterium sp. TaxID=239 RepID=UPI004047AFC0